MAQNYPELWLNRVENKLRTDDQAPWLDGIAEVAVDVSVINAGDITEKNVIHIPATDMDIEILINNNVYPIPVQNYADSTIDITLEKISTKRITLTDDQTLGSSYAQIDNVTGLMVQGMSISKFKRSAYNISATSNTATTPLIVTTGRSGRFDAAGDMIILKTEDGRLLCTYLDIVDLKDKFDKQQVPMIGRRLVLCSDHWNDLLSNAGRYADMLTNFKTGEVAPMIAGFEIYQYIANPYYSGGIKMAYDAVPDDTDYQGSFAYYTLNIAKKTGKTRQYFLPANLDPANQANTLAYRTYYIAMPKKNKYLGGIISGIAA